MAPVPITQMNYFHVVLAYVLNGLNATAHDNVNRFNKMNTVSPPVFRADAVGSYYFPQSYYVS